MTDEKTGLAWTTPGSRNLLAEIMRNALSGRPALLHARRAGACQSLARTAEEDFGCRAERVEADPDVSPLQALASLADPGVGAATPARLVELIARDAVCDAVVIVEAAPSAAMPWLTFAGLFAKAREAYKGQAASLIIVTRNAMPAPSGCTAYSDNLTVDVLDALMFVRERSQWPRNMKAQAAAAALVEVCRGDLDLIADLLELDIDEAFNPIGPINRLPVSSSPRPQHWRGRDEPCPHWLKIEEPHKLVQRIWRGQLSLLFPWLEEIRSDMLSSPGAKRLPSGLVDQVTGDALELADYEFAHIAIALKQSHASREVIDAAHNLRWCRNELAHSRPITLEDFARAERAADLLSQHFKR